MKATISNDLAIATNVANEFEKLGGMQEVEKLEAAGCGNCGVNIVNGMYGKKNLILQIFLLILNIK